MSSSVRKVLFKTQKLVRAGVIEEPAWLQAMIRCPPTLIPAKEGPNMPKPIVFPEDPLIQSYYARHPEAFTDPVDLTSFEPPLAKKFALRQLELLRTGRYSRERARRLVERELAEWEAQQQKEQGEAQQVKASMLASRQQAEQAELEAAMQELKERQQQ